MHACMEYRTCFIAGEYVQMLKRKQPELGITNTDVLHVQIAALCHDLGNTFNLIVPVIII